MKLKGDSLNSLLDEHHIKIHGSTQSMSREFEAGQHLRFVNGEEHFDGLELHFHAISHKQVHPHQCLRVLKVHQDPTTKP
jgi:hypothetical protein